MRGVWWLLALCMMPTAHAQLTIDDPVGDVHGTHAEPAPPPQPLGIDLVQGTFGFDAAGVRVAIRVDDMESIDNGSPWAGTSTEYRASWTQEGFREGSWMVRVFYAGTWSNMAEGPCVDGDATDGCAGEDRDIHDDVPMQVDVSNETIHVLVPSGILPRANVTWSEFELYAIAAQSVYPVFFSDEASDTTGFQIGWPTLEESGPSAELEGAANRTEAPADPGNETQEAGGDGDHGDEGEDNGTAGGRAGRETPPFPFTTLVVIAIVGAALARRRR